MFATTQVVGGGTGKIFQIRRLSQGATPSQGASGLKLNVSKHPNTNQLFANIDDHNLPQYQIQPQYNSFLDKVPGTESGVGGRPEFGNGNSGQIHGN